MPLTFWVLGKDSWLWPRHLGICKEELPYPLGAKLKEQAVSPGGGGGIWQTPEMGSAIEKKLEFGLVLRPELCQDKRLLEDFGRPCEF